MMTLEEIRLLTQTKLARDPSRFKHTEGVVEFALKLAKVHGEDPEKAAVAAWLHDITKLDSDSENKMRIDIYYGKNESVHWPKKVLHAVSSRAFAFQEAGVVDADILNAILFHTTGRPKMSTLEKIIYCADFLEEGRPNIPKGLRALAEIDLDRALLTILLITRKYLTEHKLPVVKSTDLAIRYYMEKRGGADDRTPNTVS